MRDRDNRIPKYLRVANQPWIATAIVKPNRMNIRNSTEIRVATYETSGGGCFCFLGDRPEWARCPKAWVWV